MSPRVPNIDQSGCGKGVSKSGGHNWEVEISNVGFSLCTPPYRRVLARVSRIGRRRLPVAAATMFSVNSGLRALTVSRQRRPTWL
jgi:hypothetical protein